MARNFERFFFLSTHDGIIKTRIFTYTLHVYVLRVDNNRKIRHAIYLLTTLISLHVFQDLNLHDHLTILQTYKFYGRMLNMNMDKILERAQELQTLLELPAGDRLLYTLR